MSHKYHHCEQYSDEWASLRIGIPTASSFDRIITPTGIPTTGKERLAYKYRLVAERLLHQCMDDHFENYWMRRGSEMEAQALEAFKERVKKFYGMRKVGFFTALDGKVGASPDGMLLLKEESGLESHGIEIKCPAPFTQVQYLLKGPEDKYKAQLQGQMFVCKWQQMHFWSFHPSMPSHYEVFHRNDAYIAKMEKELLAFCAEVDEAEDHCRGLGSFRLAERLRLSDEMGEFNARI